MTLRTDGIALAGFVGTCVAVGGLGALATTSEVEGWYQTIATPCSVRSGPRSTS
jgi:translocator protein